MDSRWPARRLEFAAEVIINALREARSASGGAGMTRQEVRDAARLHIGDTGLLDYVLKSMNNVIVGNHIVRRAVNPSNRVLEYTIQELRNSNPIAEPEPEPEPKIIPYPDELNEIRRGSEIDRDIDYLYSNILADYRFPEGETELVDLAARVVMDSKHFVKEWPFKDAADHLLRFICRVMPGLSALGRQAESARDEWPPQIPGVLIVVPLYATVGELKSAAEAAFRDTYCLTEEFVVTDIEGLEGLEDGDVLFGLVESGSEIWVRGYGMALEEDAALCEGAADNWTVRCECGARDDDGERMVACDVCEVWQHTRCVGIDDVDAVPPLFVCDGCCASLVPPRPHLVSTFGY